MSTYGKATYGGSAYGADASQTHLPERWIERTRAMLEVPQNHQTYRFFVAWQISEGGSAKWNPLNTTIAVGGTVNWDESDYNSIGVKNYKYAVIGIVAIVLTFTQRNPDGSLVYGTLLKNLRNKNLTAEQIVNGSSADIKHWGTNPTTMLSVLSTMKISPIRRVINAIFRR